ncbi:Predicted acylesterase/phospholipase RssA, contains patatin domain [Cyclobacterium xiamenense]|uniref:Predicted acylesterase/phospholipase RssA, contains patatin domain n=1 Tax=Cyclobacterium xiamenense TaxID=1297121 RepID=A0A1H6UDM3_9BACT|nr:patatin-like phospholipase family protein [Cyclobacterium xiamenense]SEI86310.1 Predicted acylesterase/phospholipase RssA, contains patatin domain [Cyclobacterium xiamenense]
MLITSHPNESKSRKSLVLAGGGIRVAYQVGVLKAMEEAGLQFDHVDGTSGGIFNAAMLASGMEVQALMDRWADLKMAHFVSPARVTDYLRPWRMKGMGDADAIRSKVFPHFGVDIASIRQKKLPITFSLCNFSKKSVQAIPAKDVHENHLLAGVSLPIVMPALQVGEDWFIDAVWIKDANLMEAVRRGAEEIWVVWGIGNYPAYLPGALRQYVHSIEMSANGGLWEEFEQIKWINKGILRGESEFGQRKPIQVFVIRPQLPLPLDPDLFFNRITTRDLMAMGYSDATEYLSAIPKSGTPLDERSTATRNLGDCLAISLHYSGELPWKDEISQVRYRVFLRYTEWEGKGNTEVYSSLYLGHLDQEFPGTAGHFSIKDSQGIVAEIASNFLIDGRTYHLLARFEVKSPWHWLAGMEFKALELVLYPKMEADPEIVMEGSLYQSFGARLRSFWKALAITNEGSRGGIGFKLKQIKKMMYDEV